MTARSRISRDEYGLKLAEAAALRADCTRRQVGAVVVAPDGSIVSTGYNGLAAGRPGCASAGACPRGRMAYPTEPPVKVGDPDPVSEDLGAPECQAETDYGRGGTMCCTRPADDHVWHVASTGPGSPVLAVWPAVGTQEANVSYEATGCRAVHAEVNAILRGRGREGCAGATMYVTDEPCFYCSVVIEGAGIVRVVTPAALEEPAPVDLTAAVRVETDENGVRVFRGDEEVYRIGAVTDGVLTVPRRTAAPETEGTLDPEILSAIRRREERVQVHRDAAARRAELARTHPGWRAAASERASEDFSEGST